ncbi:MAG: hypothetical protein AAGE52_30105 [Myxococcota bacterium]
MPRVLLVLLVATACAGSTDSEDEERLTCLFYEDSLFEPVCPEGDPRPGDPCCVSLIVDGLLVDEGVTSCSYSGRTLTCTRGRWTFFGPATCDDSEPPPEESACRSDADCAVGSCVPEIPPGPRCGPIEVADRACEAGTCELGFVCAEFEAPCQDQPDSRCIEVCSPGSCEDSEVCGDDGLCVPRQCDDGFECGPDRVCGLPDAGPFDAHGCRAARCGSEGGSCGEGFTCDEAAALPGFGGCVPVSCLDGFDCGPNRDCDPGDPSAESLHGCVKRECESDNHCECGACVNNRCEPRPFVCFAPPA